MTDTDRIHQLEKENTELRERIVFLEKGKFVIENAGAYTDRFGAYEQQIARLTEGLEVERSYRREQERRAMRAEGIMAVVQMCATCGETPQGNDPGFSNGICAYCGYWNIPRGEDRERHRAARALNGEKA